MSKEQAGLKEGLKIIDGASKKLGIDPSIPATIYALGDTEGAVHSMIALVGINQTAIAEKMHPKREPEGNYTPLERKIIDMMQENTGAALLDSGSVYGRAWEINREIRNFHRLPKIEYEAYKGIDGTIDVSVSKNIFHYLRTHLEIDELTEQWDKQFDKFLEAHPSLGYYEAMQDFLEDELRVTYGTTNTANFENVLSQVLQYCEFEYDGKTYLLLQLHNGCDVRGGYTKPRFFRVRDPHSFYGDMDYMEARCKCDERYSDYCGYSWYSWDGLECGLPEYWTVKRDRLFCTKCNKYVKVS